jgi:pimeloyl-ACP methyl ester carboxylesterase
MNVIVDGLMTNYQKTGEGKVLLMIHGWGDSARTFSALADELKDSFQIVALDLPGFGASQAPSELWGTKAFADFTAKFMDKLNLKPYGVIGHSFGGPVAMYLALDYPKFKKLVLLASAGVRNKNPVRSNLMKLTAKAGKGALAVMPARKRGQLKRKLYDSIGSDALLLPHMEKIYRKIISEDMRAAAADIQLPTLLIYGSRDKATPASDGLKLHKLIKNSDLRIVDAGHFLHQEDAALVAGQIEKFLSGGHA